MKLKKRARETFFSRGIRLGEMETLYHFIFFGVGRKSHRRVVVSAWGGGG